MGFLIKIDKIKRDWRKKNWEAKDPMVGDNGEEEILYRGKKRFDLIPHGRIGARDFCQNILVEKN